MDLIPDSHNPTYKKIGNEYEMKSGYGVDLKVSTNVNHNGSSSDVTSAQNVNTTFSEFKYKTYNRLLEKRKNNGLKSEFEFKKNKYSPYSTRTHFTPIWYKDDLDYIVNAEILDVWTPTGMLSVTLNDKMKIKGPYSTRTHFTPIWYKDDLDYIVNAEILDVWTPTGMLSVTLNDKMKIKGNLWDDRHIAIMK